MSEPTQEAIDNVALAVHLATGLRRDNPFVQDAARRVMAVFRQEVDILIKEHAAMRALEEDADECRRSSQDDPGPQA